MIRALKPTDGLEVMRQRRAVHDVRHLCAGPGRLCQALGITGGHNGFALDRPPLSLMLAKAPVNVVADLRIGLTKGVNQPWRFGEPASPS